MSEMCCTWLTEIQDAKIMQKIAICTPLHNFVGLYLHICGATLAMHMCVMAMQLNIQQVSHGVAWQKSSWCKVSRIAFQHR